METTADITQFTTLTLERALSPKILGLVFIFLFLVFAFATPYEFDYTTHDMDVADFVASAEAGSLGRKLAMPVLGIFGLVILVGKNRRQLRLNGALGVAFYCYVSLAICSLAWTDDWVLGLRKIVVFGLLLLGALGVAAILSMREILFYVLFMCGGVMLLALGTEIYQGTFLQAREYSVYQLSGIMHPNALACHISCFIVTSIAMMAQDKKRTWLYVLFTLAGFAFLFLAKSRTSMGCAVVASLIVWLPTTNLHRKFAVFLAVAVMACCIGLIFQDQAGEKTRSTVLMGREDEGGVSTFTNRTPLWSECWNYVKKRPLLGYGYDSFWTPQQIFIVSQHQGWQVPHSHNGYLEMLLSLGVVGLICYVVIIAVFFRKSLLDYLETKDPGGLYAFAMILWLCLEMLLEKVYMTPAFPAFICNLLIVRYAFVKDEEYRLIITNSPDRQKFEGEEMMGA